MRVNCEGKLQCTQKEKKASPTIVIRFIRWHVTSHTRKIVFFFLEILTSHDNDVCEGVRWEENVSDGKRKGKKRGKKPKEDFFRTTKLKIAHPLVALQKQSRFGKDEGKTMSDGSGEEIR
jgi:hypothetical protein